MSTILSQNSRNYLGFIYMSDFSAILDCVLEVYAFYTTSEDVKNPSLGSY